MDTLYFPQKPEDKQQNVPEKIIKRFDRVDFELIILEAIKLNAQERRLKDYQKVLESAVEKRTKELNNINVKLKINNYGKSQMVRI